MKYPICILLVLALLLGFTLQAQATVEPFVKADWGASPAEVMHGAGVPAFNKIDFEAKKTEFLAYRQTISAYNFVLYYLFQDEKLYQVRLELKEELWDTGFIDLGGTLNSMLEHALTINADDGFSETTVERRPQEGRAYASSRWWYTTETFALALIDTDTPDGRVVFDVLLADAANPANATLIDGYRKITAQIKAQNETQAVAQNQSPGRFATPTETPAKGFKAGLMAKVRALAGGVLNNWLRNAAILLGVVIVIIVAVILLRKKRTGRSGNWQARGRAPLQSQHKKAAAATTKTAAIGKTTAKAATPVNVTVKTTPDVVRNRRAAAAAAPAPKTPVRQPVASKPRQSVVDTARPAVATAAAQAMPDDVKFILGQKASTATHRAAYSTSGKRPDGSDTQTAGNMTESKSKSSSGPRQLRIVSASRPSSGKGSKLSFRK